MAKSRKIRLRADQLFYDHPKGGRYWFTYTYNRGVGNNLYTEDQFGGHVVFVT